MPGYILQFSPSRRVSKMSVDGTTGTDVDFAESRPATGTTINARVAVYPTDQLSVELRRDQRWLNVDDEAGVARRLFTANMSRVRRRTRSRRACSSAASRSTYQPIALRRSTPLQCRSGREPSADRCWPIS